MTGGRHDGAFYAACRGKCGPILPFMLEGLDHDPIVDPGAYRCVARRAIEPRTLDRRGLGEHGIVEHRAHDRRAVVGYALGGRARPSYRRSCLPTSTS